MYQSQNPKTEIITKLYPNETDLNLEKTLNQLSHIQHKWKNTPLATRLQGIIGLETKLNEHKNELANIATNEMGKVKTESIAEIEKCIKLCQYYATETPLLLQLTHNQHIDPIGTILGIMPWNFPYWQLIRFTIPTIVMGNTVIIKPAPNTPATAEALQNIIDTVLPENIYQTKYLTHEQIKQSIQHPNINGISLTGSQKAGKVIGGLAGKNIKPCTLELGGIDPFIICQDANIKTAYPVAITARFSNSGQACISAKRFIIHESHMHTFIQYLKKTLNHIELAPLARKDLQNTLKKQVETSIKQGATQIYQQQLTTQKGFHFPATILTTIPKNSPAYTEELFGPIACLFPFKTNNEAIKIANDTPYGLGASIWTTTQLEQQQFIQHLQTGMIAINKAVTSHPEHPFGGTKQSGYGKECGREGLLAFTNQKTIL